MLGLTIEEVSVELRYSCRDCGLHRVSCTVPARTADQDVVEWVEASMRLAAADHHRRNPGCRPREFAEVLLPMDQRTGRVGMPPYQH